VRSRKRRLLTESVADMLQSAFNGPQDLDRELPQLLADALRQTGLRRAQPLLTVAEYEDLCEEAACLRRGLFEVDGQRWCRRHALDTAVAVAHRPGWVIVHDHDEGYPCTAVCLQRPGWWAGLARARTRGVGD